MTRFVSTLSGSQLSPFAWLVQLTEKKGLSSSESQWESQFVLTYVKTESTESTSGHIFQARNSAVLANFLMKKPTSSISWPNM